MKATLLVAHPDDEVLFAGALMLSQPEVEWTVICATHDWHSERGARFAASLDAFKDRHVNIGGESSMCGLPDEGTVLPRWRYEEWRGIIEDIAPRDADVVVTHNAMGEYGHPHHMAMNAIANDLWPVVWSFYCKAPSGVSAQEKLPYWIRLDLSKGLAIPKRQIMETAYPDELVGLTGNQPELVEQQIERGPELFTSSVGWPL